jgi:LPS-assembly protein
LPALPGRPSPALPRLLVAAGLVAVGAAQADGSLRVLRQGAAAAPASATSAPSRQLPITVQAREITGRPDLETIAEGNAEFQRGPVVITSDRLSYDQAEDQAVARGKVRIVRDGNIYAGPELSLKVQAFEGYFLDPRYFFARTGSGGSAERVDFIDEQRAVASRATYTSCNVDDKLDGEGRYVAPAWEMAARKVRIDFERNEGIAEGAVLRFYGVPILAAPVVSFPLTDARKSGWLPPNIALDNKSGLHLSVPYYWNIAPNRDATFIPTVSAKRGVGLDSEYRYLEPRYRGSVNLDLLPQDRLVGRNRYALATLHDAAFRRDGLFSLRVLRVSDDDYWKDFNRSNTRSLTPRLLLSDLQASHPFGETGYGRWTGYARMQSWQVLQNADASSRIEAPYDRLPQIGARTQQRLPSGVEVDFTGEFNRFTNPVGVTGGVSGVPVGAIVGNGLRMTGSRLHALASVSRPWLSPGFSFTPKLTLNAASYATDQPLPTGRRSASRFIPTLSVDSGWVLERDTTLFGKALRQTLEPRLLYLNTPYREQRSLPVFDTAAKDFNFDSIYTDNLYSGVDRVSDTHQLTAGVTTRLLDPATGVEAVRLGVGQRFLFKDQRVTPDGQVFSQRFSDLLLLGSTSLIPAWTLESSVQYSPEQRRVVRSLASARYSPGPFRTFNATYRLTRGLSEQVELGWQWPLYGNVDPATGLARVSGERGGLLSGGRQQCGGVWYGVGRVNYSMRDRRITDSIAGLEYDAGCWIGRVVAERLSTGRSEATTRLLLQLELVGLSRLGSSPLQVLKDNIPGYRLLRDPSSVGSNPNVYE